MATRAEHDDAERVPVLSALAKAHIDAPRYTSMLIALDALFFDWESEMRGFVDAWARSGWAYASRADLIDADLRLLGTRAGAPPGQRVAAAKHAPDGSARAWGMLYVVEGSALGGRVLAARLRSALAGCAATHYLEAGAADAGRWPRFCSLLDRALRSERDIAHAIAGARSMFGRYRSALENL